MALTVRAEGVPEPTYQWQRGGVPLPGEVSATTSVTVAVEENLGEYRVVVSNAAGSVTSAPAVLSPAGAARKQWQQQLRRRRRPRGIANGRATARGSSAAAFRDGCAARGISLTHARAAAAAAAAAVARRGAPSLYRAARVCDGPRRRQRRAAREGERLPGACPAGTRRHVHMCAYRFGCRHRRLVCDAMCVS